MVIKILGEFVEQAKIDLLVMDMQGGCEKSFEELFRFYQPALIRFSYKISKHEQLAHDAVQNAWLKIARKISSLNDVRAFRSWLYQQVRWQTCDLMKAKSNQYEQLPENFAETLTDESNNDDVDSELLDLINLLPELERQAIYLFYLDDLSIKEIASVLQVPEGTIKSRLNRARNHLKQQSLPLGE